MRPLSLGLATYTPIEIAPIYESYVRVRLLGRLGYNQIRYESINLKYNTSKIQGRVSFMMRRELECLIPSNAVTVLSAP
jgi:hypothetical protein